MAVRMNKAVRCPLFVVILLLTMLAASACYEPVDFIFGTWQTKDGRTVSFGESGEVVFANGDVIEGYYKLDTRRVAMTVGLLGFEPDEIVQYSIKGFELTLSNTEGITVVLKRTE